MRKKTKERKEENIIGNDKEKQKKIREKGIKTKE